MFIFFLIIVFLIPATMMVLGLLWRKRPPKEINMVAGYRTTWSMKSKDTWNFAHQFTGLLWLFISFPIFILSVVVMYIFRNYTINQLGQVLLAITAVQIISFLLPILPTEVGLRKKFDGNGNKKNC